MHFCDPGLMEFIKRLLRLNGHKMYESWSKEALIRRVHELERQLPGAAQSTHNKRQRLDQRDINLDEYTLKKVALRISYRGDNYSGFASQSPTPHQSADSLLMNTVEDHLFRAIYTCRLGKVGGLEWSRAGRTDAGVHGVGQVVSARLRVSSKKRSDVEDVDFGRALNPQLPTDIRVTGWSIVDDAFDARFWCKWRQYKYYFCPTNLDTDAMQQACDMLIGEHDFRNFCRKDPSKQVDNYRRRLLECRIEVVDGRTAALVIRGTAFLYNQVRCTMAVLLMIGRRQEEPKIVEYLLDVEQCPKRPLYPIASEAYLVFHRCEYEPALVFTECLGHTVAVFNEQVVKMNALMHIDLLALESVGQDTVQHPAPTGKHQRVKEMPVEK